jgi:hypothetical protein
MRPQRKPPQHAFSLPTVRETPRPAEPVWPSSIW